MNLFRVSSSYDEQQIPSDESLERVDALVRKNCIERLHPVQQLNMLIDGIKVCDVYIKLYHGMEENRQNAQRRNFILMDRYNNMQLEKWNRVKHRVLADFIYYAFTLQERYPKLQAALLFELEDGDDAFHKNIFMKDVFIDVFRVLFYPDDYSERSLLEKTTTVKRGGQRTSVNVSRLAEIIEEEERKADLLTMNNGFWSIS
ncbi:MAG TPA: hypothetical protein VGT05_00420 [Patescibacteria group bacterium]|nr:hypothetical protein [Patescibacteria group bacterium]